MNLSINFVNCYSLLIFHLKLMVNFTGIVFICTLFTHKYKPKLIYSFCLLPSLNLWMLKSNPYWVVKKTSPTKIFSTYGLIIRIEDWGTLINVHCPTLYACISILYILFSFNRLMSSEHQSVHVLYMQGKARLNASSFFAVKNKGCKLEFSGQSVFSSGLEILF